MSGSGSSVFGLFASAARAQRACAALAPTAAVYVTDLQPGDGDPQSGAARQRSAAAAGSRDTTGPHRGGRMTARGGPDAAVGAWPSGKATGFGPVIGGSNPPAPATYRGGGRRTDDRPTATIGTNAMSVEQPTTSSRASRPLAVDGPGCRSRHAHEVRPAQGHASRLRAAAAGVRARRGRRARAGARGRGHRPERRRPGRGDAAGRRASAPCRPSACGSGDAVRAGMGRSAQGSRATSWS